MSRQSLLEPRSDAGGSAFLPTFQKEMNRLFDQFRSGIFAPDGDVPSLFSEATFPAVDVVDTGDALEISAEVPGVKEDELDVSITGEVLILKGEKSSDHEKTEDNYHLIERRYGSFRRQIPLGFAPQEGAVEANFKDGILKLTIARPDEAKSDVQKIKIKKT